MITINKAIGAFLVSFATWLYVIVDSPAPHVTAREWVALIGGVVINTIVVYVLKYQASGTPGGG